MTVIAFDGVTLAADKRACTGGHFFTITKLFRSGEYIVGCSGAADRIGQIRAWFDAGRHPSTYPDNKDQEMYLLAIHQSGRIERYEQNGWPVVVEERRAAMGSGRDYAIAAMHLGCTAVQAVGVACVFDEACGNGVDTLTLAALVP